MKLNSRVVMAGVILCSVCSTSTDVIANSSLQTNNHSIKTIETTPRLILASQSQFRKKAMDILGVKYECIPANIDEKAIRHSDPYKMALLISEAKARALANKEEGIIIAGDTFLVFNGKVLEKPISLNEAYGMLRALSGNKYTLVAGLAVLDTQTGKMRSTVATCDIYLRDLSDAEIIDYCNRYPVLNFAGAHETDGAVRFSEKIEGSCLIVTAFPVKELILFLREVGQDRAIRIGSL